MFYGDCCKMFSQYKQSAEKVYKNKPAI